MKETYLSPELEIIRYEEKDVIVTSDPDNDNDGDYGD